MIWDSSVPTNNVDNPRAAWPMAILLCCFV